MFESLGFRAQLSCATRLQLNSLCGLARLDELADEKLKREHSAFDLQEQLKLERKLREISEERLANLRITYENQFPNVGTGAEIDIKSASGDMKNRAEHQLLVEVL